MALALPFRVINERNLHFKFLRRFIGAKAQRHKVVGTRFRSFGIRGT
jgi:hypothetical protein